LDRDEAAGGLLIFVFGAVTCYYSLKMPIGTFRAAGSGLFPLCLGILLMALSFAFVLMLFFQKRGQVKPSSTGNPALATQVLPFLGVIALATLFFDKLGYPFTSFLLLLALLRILGMKKWAWNVLLSLSAAGISYVLFVQWLKIPLPKGWVGL
jgi:putative tricarboxylic transport membrane protein